MRDFLEKASKAYYEGNPFISDEEFDELSKKHDFEGVGYSSDFKFSHLYPMYSLQKVYEGDTKNHPITEMNHTVVVTPKLDGAAISIRYSEGSLVLALTRGDGKKGLDITEKVKLLVPNTINRKGEVQITGEIVCPKDIPNSRNLASGSLNLKDMEEFKSRPLTFIAYDIQPKQEDYWSKDMSTLQGFRTVLEDNWSHFPQDGKVFRIDDNSEYEKLGYTAHHPRGAFALKQRQEGVVTKLLDVVWRVGKSGVVAPVAILEPVLIGDATVSRATLHNIAYIEGLGLEIGCNVEVIRSGEIIPRIVRRV